MGQCIYSYKRKKNTGIYLASQFYNSRCRLELIINHFIYWCSKYVLASHTNHLFFNWKEITLLTNIHHQAQYFLQAKVQTNKLQQMKISVSHVYDLG